MTIKKLIEHLETYNPNDVIAYDLWVVEDVIYAAKDRSEPIEVTQEQAEEVIRLMNHRKDCNVGLNWDVMNYHLDVIIEEN